MRDRDVLQRHRVARVVHSVVQRVQGERAALDPLGRRPRQRAGRQRDSCRVAEREVDRDVRCAPNGCDDRLVQCELHIVRLAFSERHRARVRGDLG